MRLSVRPFSLAACVALLAILALGMPAQADAQGVTTAAILGTVTSPDGQPLRGAQVTATNIATGASVSALSSESGRYYIANLRPGGPYVVRASMLGYAESAQDEIRLSLGQELRLDFALAERAIDLPSIYVTVNPAFSSSRTGASSRIDRTTLDNLPTLNRTFTDAVVFSPHVSVDGRGTSIGGQNNRFNNIQIDGAVNNDIFGLGGAVGVPGGQANARPISMEAIQEYQVLVAPFDVRQSGFSGGLINAITRSGTNQLTGSVYGFYRNQGFVGKLDDVKFDEFTNYNFGVTVGGPIIHDRLHYFVAAELEQTDEPQTGFHVGLSDAGSIGISPGFAQDIKTIAEDMGLNPGEFGSVNRGNPLRNLFARVDYRLADNHRLTLRHNLVTAQSDRPIDRRGGFTYDFTSYMIDQNNVTNSTVVQLLSDLGPWSNEALVTFGFIRDRRNPQFFEPTFHVEFSDPGAGSVDRRVRLGAEYFSHANELDQNNIQFTNNLSRSFGDHRVTFGVHTEYFGFRNLFHPGALGRYSYNSIDNFRANVPYRYEIEVLHPDVDDVAARFGVLQLGGYVQNQWRVTDELTLTGGLRVDVPFMLDSPLENSLFASEFQSFGYRTSNIPSGNPLWAPRLGFNWSPMWEAQTQVRGGVGIFSGRPPFVWMSNAYGNTGLTTLFLRCDGALAPAYNGSNPSPTACTDGTTVTSGGAAVINIFDENFKFPQEFKANLAVDRELPLGFTGTAEVLYTKAVNQIFLQEVNIARDPVGTDPATGRPVFGTPTASGWAPSRHSNQFLNVVRGTNTSDNDAVVLTFELQRRFVDAVDVQGAYTFSRVRDTQSLGSSIATSNLGFNPVPGHPNDAPLAVSNFDRPHKVFLSATTRVFEQFGGTDVTLIYLGQSGRPYAYTIDGDVNGDMYPGTGTRATNDLLYVPAGNELAFRTQADQDRLMELIELESCLQEQQGQIMQRNSCRGPWTNMLDARIAQNLRVGTRTAQMVLDIFNLPNLINSDWGRVEGPTFSEVSALRLVGRENGTADANDRLMYSYIGSTEDGRAALPYVVSASASRWQAQLGLRFKF